MIGTEHDPGIGQGEAVLTEAVEAYRRALGRRLVAAYALGSLAHGGFSPLVSDVDLGLIMADPLHQEDPDRLQAVAGHLRQQGSALHERLSVFWGTPSTLSGRVPAGRFPPLDVLDLLEHGRLVFGHDARRGLARPSQPELLVAGAEFALGYLGTDATVDEIRRPEVLLAGGVRRVTKVVLFPARFLFTAVTGEVGTNHAAAAHYGAQSGAPGAVLVQRALGWRTTPPGDDQSTGRLLAQELVPLYRHYIDDHTARLRALGRFDLARDFETWGRRLSV